MRSPRYTENAERHGYTERQRARQARRAVPTTPKPIWRESQTPFESVSKPRPWPNCLGEGSFDERKKCKQKKCAPRPGRLTRHTDWGSY